jgi:hypothetical protein
MQGVNDHMTREACASCGESTAVGTILFSDRRQLPDGTVLCADCNSRLAAAHRGKRMTDEEVRQFIDNGNMAAITWGSNGHI